jgi:hypothetical protein
MRHVNDIISDVSNYTKSQKDILLYAVNRQWGTPVFKIDNFVGGAQFTPFGKLRQLLLELGTRETLLSEQELKIERLRLEIELENELAEASLSPAQKKIHELNILEKQRTYNQNKVYMTMTYDERDKYMMLIERFNESEEGKLSDGRLIMDIIGNHEEEEKLEAELWAVRLGAQAGYDLMFYGRVNNGNMEAIDQLPPDIRKLAIENAVEKAIVTNNNILQLENQVKQRLEIENSVTEEWTEV